MAREVRLPKFGKTMEEGTIVRVLIKEGDEIKKGDIIFEIETDKATLEMESPAEGIVKKILVEIEQTVPVGTVALILGEENEEISQGFIDSVTHRKSESEPSASDAVSESPEMTMDGNENESSKSSRPGGVFPFMRSKASQKAGLIEKEASVAEIRDDSQGDNFGFRLGQTVTLNPWKRISGEKMLQSKREIPCFYLNTKTDVTEMVELRERLNKTSEVKISFNDFIIRAIALGLKRFPIMTGQLVGDAVQLAERICIGLAIAAPGGLVAPVVKDADTMSLAEISACTRDLITRAGENKLSPEDLEEGCITLSNLGSFGIDSFIPIVVPGQCSIMGVGRITDTCVSVGGEFVARKMMNLTLAVDHKVANGADAAQFLDFVKKKLGTAGELV